MNEEREKQCSGDSSINKLLSIGITRAGNNDQDKTGPKKKVTAGGVFFGTNTIIEAMH